MKLKAKTARALRAAVEAASICPSTFNMRSWGHVTECGTTLCIGGHMLVAEGWMPMPDCYRSGTFIKEGEVRYQKDLFMELFGLYSSQVPTSNLAHCPVFYVNFWPADLSQRYHNGTPEEKVAAAREAVERFIAERGVEEEEDAQMQADAVAEPVRIG